MLGFRKADVLACIDRMSEESRAAQQQAEQESKALEETITDLQAQKDDLSAQIQEKDATLEVLQQEKDALSANLQEKNVALIALNQSLSEQESVATKAVAKADTLMQLLRTAEVSAHDYKSRLFTREGEMTVLRRDNTQLTESLSSKQKELEAASEEVAQAHREAAQEIETVRATATQELAETREAVAAELASEKQRIKNEHLVAQEQMKQSASDMAQEVVVLKQALADLDQKIGDSLQDLQRSTQMLTQALETTEDSVQRLGGKAEIFPERATVHAHAPVAPVAPAAQMARPAVRSAAKRKEKPQSISNLLLTQIARMIGEA